MKIIYRCLFFCFFAIVCNQLHADGAQKPFVVIIPSYNNHLWHERNLDSVFNQKYANFRVIYVDDASTDGNGELVQNYIKKRGQEDRVTLIRNAKRRGSLANIYKAVWLCDPTEIVVDLDGDDWFAHDHVLARLNEIYSDPDVWVTYGQFMYYPEGAPGWASQVPADIIENNSFREYSWVTTALRTFYASLFHKIRKDDLYYGDDFFPMAGDLAFMFPIVEMAGKHSRFIPETLYIYNVVTQINDGTIDPGKQQSLGIAIRSREKYKPLKLLH